MIVLDTDHVNALQSGESVVSTLVTNMDRSGDQDFATTAITIEEQMRGWLALIHRFTDAHRQIPAYDRLVGLFRFFARWKVLSFDKRAADEFINLREQRIRLGTMDLKIAAIALVNDALLRSRLRAGSTTAHPKLAELTGTEGPGRARAACVRRSPRW